MSINWVMLDGATKDFIRLPRERVLVESPARTALLLKPHSSAPAQDPLPISCSDGRAIVTNKRMIYLPTKPTAEFQSLAAPILSVQDTRVTAPFFGPNTFEGILQPTSGGGFSPQTHFMHLKLTFKEGGAYGFQSIFENIKEMTAQAAETSRQNQSAGGHGASGHIDVDLEQLPAYDGPPATSGASNDVQNGTAASSSTDTAASVKFTATGFPDEKSSANTTATRRPPDSATDSASTAPEARPAVTVDASDAEPAQPAPIHPPTTIIAERQPIDQHLHNTTQPLAGAQSTTPLPTESPPGYEEVQTQSVANTLEQQVRERRGQDFL